MLEHILEIIGTVTGIGLLVIALLERYRPRQAAGASPMSATSAATTQTRWQPTVLAIFGVTLIASAVGAWFESSPSGFNPPWPDAIQCHYNNPIGGTTPGSYNFTYNSIVKGVQKIGDIVKYDFIGNYNDPKWGYIPHEIWFSLPDKLLIKVPAQGGDIVVGGNTYKHDELDIEGQRYTQSYITKLDCGGNSIDEIVKAGNAYSFAQKMK